MSMRGDRGIWRGRRREGRAGGARRRREVSDRAEREALLVGVQPLSLRRVDALRLSSSTRLSLSPCHPMYQEKAEERRALQLLLRGEEVCRA